LSVDRKAVTPCSGDQEKVARSCSTSLGLKALSRFTGRPRELDRLRAGLGRVALDLAAESAGSVLVDADTGPRRIADLHAGRRDSRSRLRRKTRLSDALGERPRGRVWTELRREGHLLLALEGYRNSNARSVRSRIGSVLLGQRSRDRRGGDDQRAHYDAYESSRKHQKLRPESLKTSR
jgi:hypothetical protein